MKILKNVFKNIEFNEKLGNIVVEEVKYSKEANSSIVKISSDFKILATDLVNIKKEIIKNYDIKDIKFEYKYTGEVKEITKANIMEILNEARITYASLKNMFDNCDIVVNKKEVTFNLYNKYATFL